MVPSIFCSEPVPLAAKQPRTMMLLPLCFTVDIVFWGLKASPFLRHTYRWSLWPKSSSFYNTESDQRMLFQNSSSLLKCSFASLFCIHVNFWTTDFAEIIMILTHDITSEGFCLNSTLLIWRRDVIWPTSSKQGWQDYKTGYIFWDF